MDPIVIVKQLREGRRFKITNVGRFSFEYERPTEMELRRLAGVSGEIRVDLALIQEKCRGWSGVLESDIVPGGASDAMPFDAMLFREWIADRQDLWDDIGAKIAEKIEEHRKHLEALKGN